MSSTPWNCPKPAAQYKLEHEITEMEFYNREPVYLTHHNAASVAAMLNPIADCNTLIGIDPAGNLVLATAPGLIYYPAGLFKAILASNAQMFEMFATNEAGPLGRYDVMMKILQSQSAPAYYDMSKDGEKG